MVGVLKWTFKREIPMTPDTTSLTPKQIQVLRAASAQAAPWSAHGEAFWDFIEQSAAAGIQWQAQTKVLEAHTVATSKAGQQRRAQALEALRFEESVFPSGLGLLSRAYVGGLSGTGWQGDGENAYRKSSSPAPGRYDALSKVMGVFYPDIPPLLWTQVRPLLSTREKETEREYYQATSEYVVDRIDALALFRFLSHVNRLTPVQPVQDWKAIIDPPKEPPPAPKARRARVK